jgi:hypothetical protein
MQLNLGMRCFKLMSGEIYLLRGQSAAKSPVSRGRRATQVCNR